MATPEVSSRDVLATRFRKEPADNPPFKTIYTFKAKGDGANPAYSMTAVNGVLYGTTESGGKSSNGTIFSITPAGHESLLFSFDNAKFGSQPECTLVDIKGLLYGTANSPGGTAYKFSLDGKGTLLHAFSGPSDGLGPIGALIEYNGDLYGTTTSGGESSDGTVFKLAKSGNETVLYSFKGGTDGTAPYAGLTNVNGTFYGTTESGGGGSGCGGVGCGTVYKVTPSGNETVIHAFSGSKDGAFPFSNLTYFNGTLYGSTYLGGKEGAGTVFSITPDGVEKILFSFNAGDGWQPFAAPILINGSLYGTTALGGTPYDMGVVYKLSLAGKETVLHTFTGGSDGAAPEGGLTFLNGTLYGTAASGGANNNGTVFAIGL